MSWKTRGLYVWRTRKPHAVLGIGLMWLVPMGVVLAWLMWLYGEPRWWLWPWLLIVFSGRHTAYVGHTSSRWHRDQQHMFGNGSNGGAAKPWSDLDPKVYPLPCLFPRWKQARVMQEAVWIWLLWPVYNVQLNRHNPRRIKPGTAVRQRIARQSHAAGWLWPKLGRLALLLLLVGGASWTWLK